MMGSSNDACPCLVVQIQQSCGRHLGVQPVALLEDVKHVLHEHVGRVEPLNGLVEGQDLAIPADQQSRAFGSMPLERACFDMSSHVSPEVS